MTAFFFCNFFLGKQKKVEEELGLSTLPNGKCPVDIMIEVSAKRKTIVSVKDYFLASGRRLAPAKEKMFVSLYKQKNNHNGRRNNGNRNSSTLHSIRINY